MKRTIAALLAAAAILFAGISGSAAVSASSERPSQDSSVATGWWPNFAQDAAQATGWWPNFAQDAAQATGWWPNSTTQGSAEATGWWPNSTTTSTTN
ncbi:hypothetical protein [Arthrobacter sp. AZCC_0090]|uniref:hypothetical protein n=1 Tax=Arthrobacter sp. AZCC_0090 TaxID=2735881 RepID=UPI00161CC9DE|nr:hypothetical protein [Arthrobacter sp. AZCC_0090]MBB6404369.1 hypothetical protein [Arthrobacter sp. AZCC_0090]